MKTLLTGLILLALTLTVISTGCSKNDNLTGPNQNTQVSFSIYQRPGINGGTEFLFRPSSNTKLAKVVVKYPAEQFEEVMENANPNLTFSKDTAYVINEYINVTAGQQWKFNFTGTGNNAYNITADYTVK